MAAPEPVPIPRDREGRLREVTAGLTTFAAMAYILAVNPSILADGTGMDRAALVTATALASAIGTALMAALARLPIALAPGMGINAVFTYEICLGLGIPWQGALGIVFWNGILFLVLTLTGFQKGIAAAIPKGLKLGIQAGIGLFIAFIGLKNAGIVVASPATLVQLGPLSDGWMPNEATLTLLGLAVAGVLMARGAPGGILVTILLVTLLGRFIPATAETAEAGATITGSLGKVVSLPASLSPLIFEADLLYPFRNPHLAWAPVLTLMFVDLFDSIGTLLGVSRRAGLTDEDGNLPQMGKALAADAAATTTGALLGTSPVTAYVESATGVAAGGRSALTAYVVAACFLLALFLTPVILAVPAAATSPALIIVGVLMLGALKEIDFEAPAESIPAIATVILIPLGFGIANGIAVGCLLHVALHVLAGQWRKVHWFMALLALAFALKFIYATGA